ncbi:TlpA family protein disulfide reductase [Reichenbachiella versicolor]|uniref:TlpA family protein disulfide reductase n=1 Tax=Reichenbachiella versicolor TaxID=1821036 RepID=UPI000D6E19B7|nr:TlpA disulfide reductase family protein [Reichenbachiella versicolor]
MKVKKETKEVITVLAIFGLLYFTGWGKHVSAFMQKGILMTGIISPTIIQEKEAVSADYNFLLSDAEGNKVNFNEFKGKYIFLNFWATWCPPCIAEMPDINDLYLKVENSNTKFVMINLDQNFEKAKEYIAKKGYEFPIYKISSRRPEVFQSQSIPTTFIISPEGKIIVKKTGMAKYNTEEIRNLLSPTK